jgi:hypothetical protein
VKHLRRRDGFAGRNQQWIGLRLVDTAFSAIAISIVLIQTGVFGTNQRYANRSATSWRLASAGRSRVSGVPAERNRMCGSAQMSLPRAGSASFALALRSHAAVRTIVVQAKRVRGVAFRGGRMDDGRLRLPPGGDKAAEQ